MFFWLAHLLEPTISGFRVFQYTTFRALMAALTSLFIWLTFGNWTINKLKALKVGQVIRILGPESHLAKKNTPTMGGILIIFSIAISVLLWCDLSNRFVWLLLFIMISVGQLGFYDDWKKITFKSSDGVSGKIKILWLSIIAILAGLFLLFTAHLPATTELIVPFFKSIQYPLGGIGFCILTLLVIVGSSNAVNLTDGLDGLASFPIALVACALGIFAYISGHIALAHYLQFPHITGTNELLIYGTAISGACLGFLWFNTYPAKIFMGDVGSLSLGATLGTMAVIIRQEILWAMMGGLFVIEAMSVMIQVGAYKTMKFRPFRMAPIHHHFEKKGIFEQQVVVRAWIFTIICVILALSTLKLR